MAKKRKTVSAIHIPEQYHALIEECNELLEEIAERLIPITEENGGEAYSLTIAGKWEVRIWRAKKPEMKDGKRIIQLPDGWDFTKPGEN